VVDSIWALLNKINLATIKLISMQKGAIQSRRKTFQFQPDADKIERAPLAFEQRKEFMHGVDDNDLRTYIMSEALKCQGERMEDVSGLCWC